MYFALFLVAVAFSFVSISQSGLAKPAVCLEGYKMYGGTNTSA